MNKIEGLLLAVMGLFGACCALWIEEPAFSLQKDYLGVSGYPLLIGGALAGACLLRLVRLAFAPGRGGGGMAGAGRTLCPVLLAAAYVGGIASVGFLLCTFLYLAVMPFLLDRGAGARGWWKNLLYALGVAAVMYAFFRVFKIYLPDTILF